MRIIPLVWSACGPRSQLQTFHKGPLWKHCLVHLENMDNSPYQCEGLYSQLLLQEYLLPAGGRLPSRKLEVKSASALISHQPANSKLGHLRERDEISMVHPAQELCHPVPFSLSQHCNLTFLQSLMSRLWNDFNLVQWTVIHPTPMSQKISWQSEE